MYALNSLTEPICHVTSLLQGTQIKCLAITLVCQCDGVWGLQSLVPVSVSAQNVVLPTCAAAVWTDRCTTPTLHATRQPGPVAGSCASFSSHVGSCSNKIHHPDSTWIAAQRERGTRAIRNSCFVPVYLNCLVMRMERTLCISVPSRQRTRTSYKMGGEARGDSYPTHLHLDLSPPLFHS